MKPNKNFLYYLHFVKERMEIFWNRLEEKQKPWTSDIILQQYKFTNVYRILDRVSQYLVRNVIEDTRYDYVEEDIFFRILLFKHFNRIETWELLEKEFGAITYNINLLKQMDLYLQESIKNGEKIYSNAYMVYGFSGDEFNSMSCKHSRYFHVWQTRLFPKLNKILKSKSMKEVYEILRQIPGYANFISYQYCIDFNYSSLFDFHENSFVVAGPGAERGIQQTFDTEEYEKVIYDVMEHFDEYVEEYSSKYKKDLTPKLLERPLHLIDVQNCFCETDKYLREASKYDDSIVQIEGKKNSKIKNRFVENENKIYYVFPKKWQLELKQPKQEKRVILF